MALMDLGSRITPQCRPYYLSGSRGVSSLSFYPRNLLGLVLICSRMTTPYSVTAGSLMQGHVTGKSHTLSDTGELVDCKDFEV
jgi:hypothetical protein